MALATMTPSWRKSPSVASCSTAQIGRHQRGATSHSGKIRLRVSSGLSSNSDMRSDQ